MNVALLTAKLKLDVPSIATALLHDTIEDTDVTLSDLEDTFGKDIAELVDGVTKLSQVKFSSKAEQQAESFRKMLLAMAKDIRVLLVKLCDRTHNMRTLEFLSGSRQRRIAQETLDIYAPLAHRLGIYWMKSELEDLSLRYLKPEIYESISEHVSVSKKDRERYIDEVVKLLTREIEQNGLKGHVIGRPKHFYSIYEKMERHGIHFNDIYDLIAFRIIVPTTMDCYTALGVMHAAWKPIPGRFKDYIAMPKANSYQSLHTTVIGPKGARIEIQIRTEQMNDVAESGIAAHWVYKSDSQGHEKLSTTSPQFSWLKNLVESEKMLHDPVEFMSIVKEDLFPHEVFVFSPKGDLIALAAEATPIDFAYAIHTEVGHRCSGARVNGQQVPLSHRLQNGDTVEVVTNDNQTPSKDWLALVSSSKARQRIRAWLKNEEQARSVTVGKELITKDLRKVKLNFGKVAKDGSLEKVAIDLHFKDIDSLLAEIGYGKISTKQVVSRLLPETPTTDLEEQLSKEDSTLQKIFKKAAEAFRDKTGIKVNGMDDVVFRFAKCCEPLPGDELVGYVTRGRGVAVHQRGCSETLSFDPRRLIAVTWDNKVKTLRRVKLRVRTVDKLGLLALLTQSISGSGANIVGANVSGTEDGKAVSTFEINVESSEQLQAVTRALESVSGVIKVERQRD